MGAFIDTKGSSICSSSIACQELTLDADGYARGATCDCRWARVLSEAASSYIGGSAIPAEICYPLQTVPGLGLTLRIDNTDCLYFKGTAGKKIYIISGS